MISLYRKVDKSLANTYGYVSIKNVKDIKKPFLLCLSGLLNYDKSIFGMMREGARAARVYTTKEIAAGYSLDTMPIDFLGMRFIPDNNYKNFSQELVEKFFFPFLFSHGKNTNVILRQARKINLYLFDEAVSIYQKAEKMLFSKILSEGIDRKDAIHILSQVSVTALGTNCDLSSCYATSVTFVDLNDDKITLDIFHEYSEVLKANRINFMYIPFGNNNSLLYPFFGTGRHYAKDYLFLNSVAKPAISSVVNYFLENSILNCHKKQIIEISRYGLIQPLYYYGTGFYSNEMLLNLLDQNTNYQNAVSFSESETYLMNELTVCFRIIEKYKMLLQFRENDNVTRANKINKLIEGIRKYSSDVTYTQILTHANMWFSDKDKNILSEKSDRQFRNELKKQLEKKEKTISLDVQNDSSSKKKKKKKKTVAKKVDNKNDEKNIKKKKKHNKNESSNIKKTKKTNKK